MIERRAALVSVVEMVPLFAVSAVVVLSVLAIAVTVNRRLAWS